MMLFSTGTGLERVGVVGSDLDCWRAGLLDAGSSALNRNCNNGDLRLHCHSAGTPPRPQCQEPRCSP